MNDPAIVLTPLLVLLILALFRFTGCKPFGSDDAGSTDTGPSATPSVPPPTYEQIVAATPGVAAHWRLNETGGNVANVLGSLKPDADGLYKTGPAGATGLTLGKPGVLSHKDSKDFAPELNGTAAYVEVPFNGPLNTASFSVELWVKPNPALGPNTQIVISSHKIDATNKRGYEIALIKKAGEPHQQVRARVFSAAPGQDEVTAQPNQGNPDDWRHIVMTYQAGANKLTLYVRVAGFINPAKGGPGTAVYENVLSANPSTLRFGAGHQQGPNAVSFYAGLIDEVAFYNVALPEADIEKHFKEF